MGKFYILAQILQGNALFTGKIYTTGNFFTWLPVETVETNLHLHTSNYYERSVSSNGHQRQHLGNNYIEMLKTSFEAVTSRILDYLKEILGWSLALHSIWLTCSIFSQKNPIVVMSYWFEKDWCKRPKPIKVFSPIEYFPIFEKLCCNFFMIDMVVYVRRYDGQIVWNACTWFPEMGTILRGGGQLPFGTFPKIHPIW